ncbi:cupin domain-containing protein [Pseudoxanthomonas dokdonensis]|uniref:DUF985 domain-containing protein n=1 Tax=Pseudoxanthomonas dokdonensis TaxID=344882 RepID=A0A0R0CIQ4_9GAMM|nr:cupin domain-containing protein [Pseudoxanthomonas dokdonensis]KRG69110.1 hypothetical protein ABB29_11880 [Pseudoxanthomonas dokdonensis]
MDSQVQTLVRALQLAPHPEGGFYRRIHTATGQVQANGRVRPAETAIDYLLPGGVQSRWHRIDASETWQWLQGDALQLSLFDAGADALTCHRLHPPSGDPASQAVMAGVWQSARSQGDYSLMRCTVTPGFVWEGFEMLASDHDVALRLRQLGQALP